MIAGGTIGAVGARWCCGTSGQVALRVVSFIAVESKGGKDR